jgi:hypothetical protein
MAGKNPAQNVSVVRAEGKMYNSLENVKKFTKCAEIVFF